MKFIATVEVEISESTYLARCGDPVKPVTSEVLQEFVKAELHWAGESFDGLEVKDVKEIG
jgi:hypothetical protein